MKTIVSKMSCEKAVVTNWEQNILFDLYLLKHGDQYDIYVSQHGYGNMYLLFGGYLEDLKKWCDGEEWWEVARTYILETDDFREVLTNDRVLEQYWDNF